MRFGRSRTPTSSTREPVTLRPSELYEEVLGVIDASEGESELAQNLTPAYFYIGNAYDSLYKPGGEEAENVHNLNEAIRYYELAVENIPDQSLEIAVNAVSGGGVRFG